MRTSFGIENRSSVDARTNSPGWTVTLSATRTSYDAADSPNDMPRTTARSANGQIIGADGVHRRRISWAGKIIVVPLFRSHQAAHHAATGACARFDLSGV